MTDVYEMTATAAATAALAAAEKVIGDSSERHQLEPARRFLSCGDKRGLYRAMVEAEKARDEADAAAFHHRGEEGRWISSSAPNNQERKMWTSLAETWEGKARRLGAVTAALQAAWHACQGESVQAQHAAADALKQ